VVLEVWVDFYTLEEIDQVRMWESD
jgi:hypothetical protein